MAKTKTGYIETEETMEEQRRQTRLTRWEMETTVNYNAEEKTAILYTRDKTVMRKLDKLVEKCPDEYKLIAETDIDKTYEFPKKLIAFRMPRVLTDEQRQVMANRLAKARGKRQTDEEVDEFDEDYDGDDVDEE